MKTRKYKWIPNLLWYFRVVGIPQYKLENCFSLLSSCRVQVEDVHTWYVVS